MIKICHSFQRAKASSAITSRMKIQMTVTKRPKIMLIYRMLGKVIIRAESTKVIDSFHAGMD